MLVEEVNKLIEEREIVACKIKDLKIIEMFKNMQTRRFEFPIKPIIVNENQRERITFLYKIDDSHYVEYYSKYIVTIIDSVESINLHTKHSFSKFEEDYNKTYQKSPFVILNQDLQPIDKNNMEKFNHNQFANIETNIITVLYSNFLNADFKLRQKYKKAKEEIKEAISTLDNFDDLKDKTSFVVALNDLKFASISNYKFISFTDLKYCFVGEKNLQVLKPYSYILLTKVAPNVYEEYHSKIKILDVSNDNGQKILLPQNMNEFNDSYNFLLDYPIIMRSNVIIPFDDDAKRLLATGLDKEQIKAQLKEAREEAIAKLKEEYDKVKEQNMIDAYADNALVNIALRLQNNDTED